MSSHAFHTVGEEWLAAYAAGALSPAKSLVIACQAAIEPRLRTRLAAIDYAAGALVESAEGEALSDGFLDRVMDAIDSSPAAAQAEVSSAETDAPAWMPAPLARFMADADITLDWRAAGPHFARAPLFESESGERLYLLRADGGFKIPEHGHRGEEWTLLLQGGYHVGDEGYVAGDLHQEDETCTHRPIIDPDGPCISLIAIEGRLSFRSPVLRLVQPLLGV